MRADVDAFEDCPDDALPELGILVPLDLPRLLHGKVFVQPAEPVHCDGSSFLQLKVRHVSVGNRRHLRDVKRPVGANHGRHFGVAELFGQVGCPVHQVADRVCEVRVVDGDQIRFRKLDVLTVPTLLDQKVSNRVRRVLFKHVVRIHHVADGFAHLGTGLVLHKPVAEDGLWQRQLC